jgi:hypothetical protein
MIQYNVTVKIDLDVHEDWLNWMTEIHIPEVMETGIFLSNRIARVLFQDETDGITYSFQYICEDMSAMQKYSSTFAPALQKAHADRYEGKFVAFRTMLEIIKD